MKTKTAIIYYSSTGGTFQLAEAIAEGARWQDVSLSTDVALTTALPATGF